MGKAIKNDLGYLYLVKATVTEWLRTCIVKINMLAQIWLSLTDGIFIDIHRNT